MATPRTPAKNTPSPASKPSPLLPSPTLSPPEEAEWSPAALLKKRLPFFALVLDFFFFLAADGESEAALGLTLLFCFLRFAASDSPNVCGASSLALSKHLDASRSSTGHPVPFCLMEPRLCQAAGKLKTDALLHHSTAF